ncbi:MAG: hypothetical protein Q8910_00780 [Bacteroidota bacterium]|nr:hypothetical protein [Bacteroidota bacterium]
MYKLDEPLLYVDLSKDKILSKSNNRQGLVQQIVTYVRDGRTITRKQWVRSEFEKHAKKDEEEKRETLLNEQERARKKRTKDEKEAQEIAQRKGEREAKRGKRIEKESELKGHHSKPKTKFASEIEKERLRKLKDKDKDKDDDEDKDKKDIPDPKDKGKELEKPNAKKDDKQQDDKQQDTKEDKKKKRKLRTGKQKGVEQAYV